MPLNRSGSTSLASLPPYGEAVSPTTSHGSRTMRRLMTDSKERKVVRRGEAIGLALVVTFLWSTSWILIKWGLPSISPLVFAGLRYSIAFLCLAPFLWLRRREARQAIRRGGSLLLALGVTLYAATQGGQFLALGHLEATTLSLCLSMTAVGVALISLVGRREAPGRLQWLGVAVAAAGALAYFTPRESSAGTPIGYVFAGVTVVANAAASLLGRRVNRAGLASPVVVTALSMGVGAAILLTAGLIVEGVPRLSAASWGLIAWLAIINTALSFTMWNRSLQTLTAVESSVLNNTMLIQVALLAWAFLSETHNPLEVAGLVLVAAGTAFAQIRRASPRGSHGPAQPDRSDG